MDQLIKPVERETSSTGPVDNSLDNNIRRSSNLNLNNLNLTGDINNIILPESSPSIALLNAKTKALRNLQRVDRIFNDKNSEMINEKSEMAFKSSNNLIHNNRYSLDLNATYSKSENNNFDDDDDDRNLSDELNFYKDRQFYKGQGFESNIDDKDNNINDSISVYTVFKPPIKNTDNQFEDDTEYNIFEANNYKNNDKSVPHRRSIDVSDLNYTDDAVPRHPSSKKSKPKGFNALFGRKNRYPGHYGYGNHIVRNSIKSKNAAKQKINNNIDWSENSKLGIHVWSDHSNPTTDSCYINEPDILKFHNINSQGKCLYTSKNVPKKKCNICKIVVHETCIESLQQSVKCRQTYKENITRKKSFREKEHSITHQSSLNTPASNANLHHWICHKFDENNFENKCQSCQKSYTNRFGLQTNRLIISCSWCKQAYHLKCFEEKGNLKTEECSFGEHKQLMVPPSWIVKLNNKSSIRSNLLLKSHNRASNITSIVNNPENGHHSQLLAPALKQQPSIRNSTKAFIVRPPALEVNLSLAKPLLVLINPKSGGKVGPKLLKKFTWLLNARQVFDLSLNPKFPLYLYRNVPNLRILVGGGDGSVGWVLSVIDQIKFLDSPPSVAVLPLGTGNDMARALHWGGTYNDEPLHKVLNKVLDSKAVKLDRWKTTITPNKNAKIDPFEKDETAVDSLKNDVMNNYFSIGADAHIALDFHEKREANPQKFTSRWFNLYQYMDSWKGDIIKKTWKDLKNYIELECDGISYTEMIKSKGYHCILFLNISKYSGGTEPWGSQSNQSDPKQFQQQSMNDGKIEVIGIYTSTLAKIHIGIGGDRICQAKSIKLTTSTNIPIQIDGEPVKICPSIIEITHKNQATMLEHVKNNFDSPLIAYHSNVNKSFEVKYISMSDYKHFRKDHKKLESKAINAGTICTSNLLDNLSKVKNLINVLLKNSANGYCCNKWSFLSAEEFYRISDDSDECLLDIVSTDEIVYILDESEDIKDKTPSASSMSHQISDDNNMNTNEFDQCPKEHNNENSSHLLNESASSNNNKSVFRIPASMTSQNLNNKLNTSSMPSSRSTQFNSKVPSFV